MDVDVGQGEPLQWGDLRQRLEVSEGLSLPGIGLTRAWPLPGTARSGWQEQRMREAVVSEEERGFGEADHTGSSATDFILCEAASH